MNQSNATAELLFKHFGAISLTTEQLSTVIPRSVISLRRDRAKKQGIAYTKFNNGSGRNIAMYSIYDVADFMTANKLQTTPQQPTIGKAL